MYCACTATLVLCRLERMREVNQNYYHCYYCYYFLFCLFVNKQQRILHYAMPSAKNRPMTTSKNYFGSRKNNNHRGVGGTQKKMLQINFYLLGKTIIRYYEFVCFLLLLFSFKSTYILGVVYHEVIEAANGGYIASCRMPSTHILLDFFFNTNNNNNRVISVCFVLLFQ